VLQTKTSTVPVENDGMTHQKWMHRPLG